MYLKHLAFIFSTSVSIFLITGCAVGPDFKRPEAAVSKQWMEVSDERIKSAPADYRNWWKVFNDPVLDRLIDRAYHDNLSLKIAGMRVLQARAQLGISYGGLFPQTQQVAGSLQYNRISSGAVTSAIPVHDFRESQIGLNASWELDFWGKFRRMIESDRAIWLSTVADYDNALVTLTADVANVYVNIRTLQKRIEIARQNVETQKENLSIAEAKFNQGVVTEFDVDQARTSLDNALSTIPLLETQLRQAGNALSVLLGLPPDELKEYIECPSEIPVSPPSVAVGIPADLLRRRPDIRSAEYQAAAQSANIGVAKAELYPAFSLNGSFGFVATDIPPSKLSDMFRWRNRSIQAGPSVQWNIFNYGRLTNNVRLQDARFQELLIAYQNSVLNAQREVEDNLIAFLKAQERLQILARSTEWARNALNLAVLQYREGIKDFTAVLISQQTLLNEQDNLATTLGSVSSNLIGVYRSLGGGWEIREGQDFIPASIKDQMTKRTNWGRLLEPAQYNPPAAGAPK